MEIDVARHALVGDLVSDGERQGDVGRREVGHVELGDCTRGVRGLAQLEASLCERRAELGGDLRAQLRRDSFAPEHDARMTRPAARPLGSGASRPERERARDGRRKDARVSAHGALQR